MMGPTEMNESKTQLHDLIDKSFTRLNVFFRCISARWAGKRDRIMYLCSDFQ